MIPDAVMVAVMWVRLAILLAATYYALRLALVPRAAAGWRLFAVLCAVALLRWATDWPQMADPAWHAPGKILGVLISALLLASLVSLSRHYAAMEARDARARASMLEQLAARGVIVIDAGGPGGIGGTGGIGPQGGEGGEGGQGGRGNPPGAGGAGGAGGASIAGAPGEPGEPGERGGQGGKGGRGGHGGES